MSLTIDIAGITEDVVMISRGEYEKFKKVMRKLQNDAEDAVDLALALERLKNDTGIRYTQEEVLAQDGLTLEDLDLESINLSEELE